MFRTAYYEHPDYVPLLRRAHDQWRELEARGGVKVFYEVGGLYMGRPEGELLSGSLLSARTHGLDHRELTWAELSREHPQFVLPREFVGIMEPGAGFIVPDLAVKAMVDQAVVSGAVVLEGQRITGWTASAATVTVKTVDAEYVARKLVITAGGWTAQVLPELASKVVVTRQVLGWVRPKAAAMFAGSEGGTAGFPCWGIGNDDGSLHYGFPMMSGEAELKIALHARGRETNPDEVDRVVTAADEATFRSVIARHIPGAEGPTVRTAVCTYANSPDSHFIIDRHPEHAHVVFACGFSGHGFKFAPVVGEALADLALNDASDLPIGFLGLDRLKG
jgi:sarcosine oxidase